VTVGYYAGGPCVAQRDDAAVAAALRGHWSAIKNGAHCLHGSDPIADNTRTPSCPRANESSVILWPVGPVDG